MVLKNVFLRIKYLKETTTLSKVGDVKSYTWLYFKGSCVCIIMSIHERQYYRNNEVVAYNSCYHKKRVFGGNIIFLDGVI
jgi:hypothetical protein